MKKYILYDDKVYEIKINEKLKKEGTINYYYIKTSPHTGLLFTKNELKEYKTANTIEELCDTYVFVGEDKDVYGNPLLWNIKQDIPFLIKYYLKNNVIYGATWTDKGLIYVAKLNDKGKLELI